MEYDFKIGDKVIVSKPKKNGTLTNNKIYIVSKIRYAQKIVGKSKIQEWLEFEGMNGFYHIHNLKIWRIYE